MWEALNNENFNRVRFDTFRNEAGLNRFTMTPQKWIESTNAIGIIAKAGRYGGTYAHYLREEIIWQKSLQGHKLKQDIHKSI